MADDQPQERRRRDVDRERVVRTLTFWLRPEFLLRVVSRFQKVAGFDRSIALASGALTAIIPLTIVTSALSSQLGGKGTADRLIDRYDLTGGGAEAVRDIFSPPTGTSTSVGVLGFLFLMVAVLSFARAVQRLFEQTWELEPLSVRNTFNGLLWIGGLVVYAAVSGILQAELGHSRLEITATVLTLVVTVAAAAGGREVRDELDRIGRGERPADDEVRRQWDEVTAQARSRWDTLRLQIQARRRKPDVD